MRVPTYLLVTRLMLKFGILLEQLYRSKGDGLAKNFVSTLPNAIFLEKQNIIIDEVHNVQKGWNAEKKKGFLNSIQGRSPTTSQPSGRIVD